MCPSCSWESLVDFFHDRLPELERAKWVQGIAAQEHLSYVGEFGGRESAIFERHQRVTNYIFGFLRRLGECCSEDFLVRECFPTWPEADCCSKYNRNHCLILMITGALAFVEAAMPSGSPYLTSYALKVIERITVALELVEPLAVPAFLALLLADICPEDTNRPLVHPPGRFREGLEPECHAALAPHRLPGAGHSEELLSDWLVEQLLALGLLEFDFMDTRTSSTSSSASSNTS
jgi:hypothetical protein